MRPRQLLVLTSVLATGCGGDPDTAKIASAFTWEVRPFGSLQDGEPVKLIALRNVDGIEVDVTTFGAAVTRLLAPDRNGGLSDVVLGYDSLEGYVSGGSYFGAIVGRYGNRIARGRFTLDGIEYELALNDGPNHLHGGRRGFDKVVWEAEPYATESESGVVLTHVSPAGEEGYPGELVARVTYALAAGAELRIHYEATTDAATIVNLTHHGYWNLAGHDAGDILDHGLTIHASRYTPVDETLIPTGELAPVDGTAFDFRVPTRIGARIESDDEQIRFGGGYDHNSVLDDWQDDGEIRLAATLLDPASGRRMDVLTTEPGIQFYSGNFLTESETGKGGAVYGHRGALCLETQHYPDSPNHPGFPSTVLRPGETYRSTTVYRFSAE